MVIRIVEETERKRAIIEKCDSAFIQPITLRDNYEIIFAKIDKYAVFIAAFDESEVVGYAAVYANDTETKTAYISLLIVTEEKQGRHIGSALLKKCIDLAVSGGMARVRLEVLKRNADAVRFYEQHGFAYKKDSSGGNIYMIRELA